MKRKLTRCLSKSSLTWVLSSDLDDHSRKEFSLPYVLFAGPTDVQHMEMQTNWVRNERQTPGLPSEKGAKAF